MLQERAGPWDVEGMLEAQPQAGLQQSQVVVVVLRGVSACCNEKWE
jgi:hypothetical protein